MSYKIYNNRATTIEKHVIEIDGNTVSFPLSCIVFFKTRYFFSFFTVYDFKHSIETRHFGVKPNNPSCFQYITVLSLMFWRRIFLRIRRDTALHYIGQQLIYYILINSKKIVGGDSLGENIRKCGSYINIDIVFKRGTQF